MAVPGSNPMCCLTARGILHFIFYTDRITSLQRHSKDRIPVRILLLDFILIIPCAVNRHRIYLAADFNNPPPIHGHHKQNRIHKMISFWRLQLLQQIASSGNKPLNLMSSFLLGDPGVIRLRFLIIKTAVLISPSNFI